MTFEVFKTKRGQYRWRLRRPNGQIVSIKPGRVALPANTIAKESTAALAAVDKILAKRVGKTDGKAPGESAAN